MDTAFEKLFISLRYYLQGKGYYKSLEALAFAREYHTGKRKDGVTPELQHQVEQALHLTTLKDVIDEQGTLITILLHDVQEDYDVPSEVIAAKFGSDVAASIWAITKKFRGAVKTSAEYNRGMASDVRASLAKGCDRVHNQQSMHGVFDLAKQRAYITETRTQILPMLKTAGYNFPQQQLAYQNVRQVLKRQCQLVENMLKEVEVLDHDLRHTDAMLNVQSTELTRLKRVHTEQRVQIEGLEAQLKRALSSGSNTQGMINAVVSILNREAEQLPKLLEREYPNQRYLIRDLFRDGLRTIVGTNILEKELIIERGMTPPSKLQGTAYKDDVLEAGGTKQETVG